MSDFSEVSNVSGVSDVSDVTNISYISDLIMSAEAVISVTTEGQNLYKLSKYMTKFLVQSLIQLQKLSKA